MLKMTARFIISIFLAGLALLPMGCGEDGGSGNPNGVIPGPEDLPANPAVPANPSGSSAQLWYFGYKSYDNTFRIRFPTYFATALGVGPGSYTLVNGQNARFRGFDTDHRARRPSYTIPGPKSRFSGIVTCILYSAEAKALGWFTAPAHSTTQGSLP